MALNALTSAVMDGGGFSAWALNYRMKCVAACGRLTIMAQQNQPDPILARFRAALAETYGDRLERAVLFGSRARDVGPNSDYDIAVFLNDPASFWQESGRLAEIETAILRHRRRHQRLALFRRRLPRARLMNELRRDGCDL